MPLLLPMIAGVASIASIAAVAYYATYAVRSQWLGRTVWRGRTDTGAVALTFDDGPSEDTERVLDVLDEYGLRATFFMTGRHVEGLPHTARRVVAEGHEVGNHSYSHPIFLYITPGQTQEQLERAQAVIAKTIGISPKLARPPCGVRTPAYFRVAEKLGLRTVQWDVTGFDWKTRSAKQIAGDVLRQVVPGSIILLHDGDSEGKQDRRETVVALPLIIEGLRKRGLRIVPLTEMLVGSEVELAA